MIGYQEVPNICLTPATQKKMTSLHFRTLNNITGEEKQLKHGPDQKKVKFSMVSEKLQIELSHRTETNSDIQTLNESQSQIPNTSDIVKNIPELKGFLDLGVGSFMLRRIFKASQHNFDVKKFHELCDTSVETIVLAEINNGNIIGGYTPLRWNDNYANQKTHYKTDKTQKSFIFNFTSKQKYPILRQTNNKAIVGCQYLGPTFGGGYDFSIGNFANKKYSSSCDFPASYSKPIETKNIKLNRRSLIGISEELFLIKEWEVFEIILKNQTTIIENFLKDENANRNVEQQNTQSLTLQKGYWNGLVNFFIRRTQKET